MASQSEKVGVDRQVGLLQDRAPDGLKRAFRGRLGAPAPFFLLALRRRQGAGVELAAGRQRQRRELDEHRRQHVFRQADPAMRRQVAGGRDRIMGDNIGQQRAAVRRRHDGRLRYARMRGEHLFDFSEFDAVAAQLDLGIAPV
ncbi:hypothetical protein D3C87_1068370 [compost metagenome]